MSETSVDTPTRKTRGKKKNYALLEDEDEELFQKLLDQFDEEEENALANEKVYQEECDPNFNPLTRKPMAQHKHKGQKRKRGRPRLFSLGLKKNRRSDSKEGSQNNDDSTNDMEDTNEDMNHSASKADLAHDMTDCDVGDTEIVKKKRGRKRKVEEWTYKSSLHNKPVNDVVVKEKLLADMNLGIDRNLPVEEIIGATIELGFPAYMVTWKGSDEADLLPAEICKRKYPQPLLCFFEKHLSFPC